MRLASLLKDPDVSKAAAIDWTTYIGSDTINSASWTAPTGLAIVGSPSLAANVATAIVSGGQEGCDYALTCRITMASGATEDGTVLVQVRSGEADPRLTR